VDDFGVKYVGREDAEHLMTCIKKNYYISSDWNGTAYCGLTLEWDYKNITADLSMPGYIKAALHKYQHPAPARPEHAPHTWNPPIYGMRLQPAPPFPTKMSTNYNSLRAHYYIMQGPLIQHQLCQSTFWHLNNRTPHKSQQIK
jgi:hypothetical protein